MSTMKIRDRALHPDIRLERRAKSPKLNIIGISSGYHDSACCLMQDGVLVAAVQEERFTRVKNDKSVPRRAFRYCLKAGGLTLSDVDCIAYYEDPCLKLGRQLWLGLLPDLPRERRDSITVWLVKSQAWQVIRGVFGYVGRIEIVDHHRSHPASSYFSSG